MFGLAILLACTTHVVIVIISFNYVLLIAIIFLSPPPEGRLNLVTNRQELFSLAIVPPKELICELIDLTCWFCLS
jgi:hypothetical protein